MVFVHCPSSHCHLSIKQVSFQSLLYFPRYGPYKHPLWKNKWLMGDNLINIQRRIMVFVHWPSPHCHLSINKFHFNPFCTFQDMAFTSIHYEQNKWLMGDNLINIQGRIMVLVHWPSPHCHLSINQVSFQSLQ
mgnify:CR=1 FL=1